MDFDPTKHDVDNTALLHLDGVPSLALRALPVIETLQSVSATATNLGVSQPAVSRAISTLEKRLGVPVLRRGRMPVTLTDEGKRMAELARREAVLIDDALKDIEDARRLRTGTVRIGSFGASASTRILPDLIVKFSKRYPDVIIEVREIADVDMPQALHDGIVDVALLVEPEGETFEVVFIATDRLVALLPEKGTSSGQDVSAGTLSERPFVMTKGGSEPLVRRWFAQSDHVPEVRHEALQISSILSFVRAGLGVSIIAELAIPDNLNGVRVAPLTPPAPRQVVLARTWSTPRTPVADTFWRFIGRNND
ncbi:LysR family transcriptional regulator [Pseudophaeobacter sp.]|uniref:LysR family transcriptional regulator n=1 Tax=Pseudophaeobacter sp. TaxID=1971739 RepID=UPI00329885F5